jgi:OFA family oxalate/formate antiporter-like MFS transporter
LKGSISLFNNEVFMKNGKGVLTLIGTVITQFALGSVYTWSLFNAGLSAKLSNPISQIAFTFGLLSLCLALASSIAGKLQDKFGVKLVTVASGILFFIGMFLTSHANSLMMLWLCGGVLVGLADGTGYLLTLTNAVRFFPRIRGVVSAISIGAYGLGALAFKFFESSWIAKDGMTDAFVIWGVVVGVLVVIGGLMMSNAPKVQSQMVGGHKAIDMTLGQSMKTSQYWFLALMFLTTCMAGLFTIGIAKDLAQNLVHLDVSSAANTVTIIAACNLIGRVVMGLMTDVIKRIRVITFGQIVCIIGIAALVFFHLTETKFFVAVGCVAFCFGGTITAFPSLVSEFFGLNNVTKNYGVIYLGFGIGSFLGSVIASLFGGFHTTFYVVFILLIISIICSLTIRPVKQ